MSLAKSRSLLLILAAAFILAPADTYGRGPGGRGGGPSAGHAVGGHGKQSRDLKKPTLKKNDGPQAGSIDVGSQAGPKFGGPNQNFGDVTQKLQGNLRNSTGELQGFQGALKDLRNGLPGGKKPANENAAREGFNGQHQQTAQNAVNDVKNGSQPFTAQWYADHPNAWQYTHPHADAWAAATATGVAAWLGWNAYGNSGYGTSYSTTYIEEQPADESYDDSYASTDDLADDDYAADDQSEAAQDGTSKWLTLGVYAVQSTNGEPASRYLQLAVNRQGELRGVYYDEISGSSQNLSGRIDQSTQVATWSLDSNQAITFRANLSDLTQSTGTVEVTQTSGTQQWRIAREQNGS